MQEMKDLMFAEFAKYQVLPLDASASTRFVAPRPSLAAGRTVFTYSGATGHRYPERQPPSLLNTSYTITAKIDVPRAALKAWSSTQGGRFGGYALYLLKGKPVFTWNLLDLKRIRWEGPEVALAPGKHTIVYDFKYDGLGDATLAYNNLSGVGSRGHWHAVTVDGKVVSTQKMERTVPSALPLDQTFDIGSDRLTPVDDRDYQVPFAFTGKIDKLMISLDAANPDGGRQEEAARSRTRETGRELRLAGTPSPRGERGPACEGDAGLPPSQNGFVASEKL